MAMGRGLELELGSDVLSHGSAITTGRRTDGVGVGDGVTVGGGEVVGAAAEAPAAWFKASATSEGKACRKSRSSPSPAVIGFVHPDPAIPRRVVALLSKSLKSAASSPSGTGHSSGHSSSSTTRPGQSGEPPRCPVCKHVAHAVRTTRKILSRTNVSPGSSAARNLWLMRRMIA